jgi:aminocarboxymuconate-semialdehyde decarboxylase
VHLAFLIQQMGAAHVVLGTDYPFDMGYYDPLGLLEGVRGLSDEDKELIRSQTAARLLNIKD